MVTALILVAVVVGAAVFAAMATAPHIEPAELREANDAERAALRSGCIGCSAESDADECRRCGEAIADALRRPAR